MADRFLRPSSGGPYGSNNGTSYADAWHQQSSINLGNGDTLYICGEFTERVNLDQGAVTGLGDNLIIRGDYWAARGIISAPVNYTFSFRNRQNCFLIGLEVNQIYSATPPAGGWLFYTPVFDIVENCSGTTIDRCIVTAYAGTGIAGRSDATIPVSSGLKIINNIVRNVGSHGIYVAGTNNLVMGNLVDTFGFGAGGHGIGQSSSAAATIAIGATWTLDSGVYKWALNTNFTNRELTVQRCINKTATTEYTETTVPPINNGEFASDTSYLYVKSASNPSSSEWLVTSGSASNNLFINNTVLNGASCLDGEGGVYGYYPYAEGHGLVSDDGAGGFTAIGNKIENNAGSGVSVNWAKEVLLYGNIIINAGIPTIRDPSGSGNGVSFSRTTGSVAHNNTIVGCRGRGISDTILSNGIASKLYNNICVNNQSHGIDTTSGDRITNVFYGNGTNTGGTGTITTDPLLQSDYSLGAGSPARAAGTWIAGVRAYDDLPLSLHPDIGAVQDRNYPGRRFGAGGGKR